MGIITQESMLFNNIAFGLTGISESMVIEAAKIANAHEFIVGLETGCHTNYSISFQ